MLRARAEAAAALSAFALAPLPLPSAGRGGSLRTEHDPSGAALPPQSLSPALFASGATPQPRRLGPGGAGASPGVDADRQQMDAVWRILRGEGSP